MRLEIVPGVPPTQIFQLLPEDQVIALRGKKVTLGAWVWADKPLTANAFTLFDGQQSFSKVIRIGTSPKFFTLSAVLTENASHARVIMSVDNQGSSNANTVFYDGLVLVEGARPLEKALPQFDNRLAQQGIWGKRAFSNLLRNASGELSGPGIRQWFEKNRPKFLFTFSPELTLGSLFDWQGAGWYYQATSQNLLQTFWAKFGWGQVPLIFPFTSQPYLLLGMFTISGLVGTGLALWHRRFILPWNVSLFLGIAMVGVLGQAFLRGIHSLFYPWVFIPGARYVYPVIIPILLVLNTGWLEIVRSLAHWIRFPSIAAKYSAYFLFFLGLDIAALISIVYYYKTGGG
jgi:hypothetical protein